MAESQNQLSQLRLLSQIVADTGEIEQIKKFKPLDATTNPSLIYKAAQMNEYSGLVRDAISKAKSIGGDDRTVMDNIMDNLAVNFGVEILKHVDGVVSTELDARLSFNTEACVAKALKLCKLYEAAGIDPKKRVLFKIASTWEGLQAMKILQEKGINCNMTLLFSLWQAAVAAEWGAFLISPFVGRITDWFMKQNNQTERPPVEEDPGVLSVRNIHSYYKHYDFKTIVMGASFRSTAQVLGLAGVDKLTVSPKLLEQLQNSNDKVNRALASEAKYAGSKLIINEQNYRWGMNEEPVAVEKLAEGIRRFAADTVKLEEILSKMLKTNSAL